MENLLTYILQVNLLLALIYLGYHFLLKGLTFYNLNRVYFIVGGLYAFAYPFINIKAWFAKNEVIESGFIPEFLPSFEMPAASTNQITLLDVLIAVISVLAVLFVGKLLIQLISLLRIHLHSKNSSWQSYIFRNVVFPVVPFSFFNKIYIHKQQHQETELQDIFAHEIVHVRGHHTVDILLFEIILVVCWYNPFVWLMRKAVRQNLEFLTDQQVLNKGVDKQTYQYSLLHVTRQGVAVGMSNHFNFKTLKKRIMMMNKKRSSKLELSKYAFLLPVFLIAGMSFTVSKAENNIEKVVEVTKDTPLDVSILKSLTTLKDEVLEVENSINGKIEDETFTDSIGYVLDDKLVSINELKSIKANDIETIVINTNNDLTKKFDKKSILNIKTKKYSGTLGTPSQFKEFSINEKHVLTFKGGHVKSVADDNVERPSNEIFGLSFQTDSTSHSKNRIVLKGVQSLGFNNTTPLIILEGKEIDPEQFKLISPNNIESITVLKDQSATALYGDKGKDGVIIVTSKKGAASDKKIKEFSGLSVEDGGKNIDAKALTINLGDDASLADKNITSSQPNKPVITIKGKVVNSEEKPLIIVDGKETDLTSIDSDDIESMDVLKNESATALYGDKGKHGVILIKTREQKQKIDSKINDAVNKEIQTERQKNETPIYADRSKGFSVALRVGSDVQQENKILDDRVSSTWEEDYYTSMNNFLEKNKSNIDLSRGYVLIIDNKLATEKDLKEINKEYVKTVSATDIIGNKDITVDFSNKLAGILRLTTTSNKSEAVRSMSASVENNGKSYKLLLDNNSNHPIIKIQ